MKKTGKRLFAGAAGAMMLTAGYASAAAANSEATSGEVTLASFAQSGYGVTVKAGEAARFDKVANVEGVFAFDQDVLSPTDDVFSIFGTAMVGVCAKPGFALEEARGVATHYVNVSGNMKKAYSVRLEDLKAENSETKIMSCKCAHDGSTVNAKVSGIPLSAILGLGEVDESVNTITVKGEDGYGIAMPLSYVMDRGAMIAYCVNDKALPSGSQLWMPETTAKYFTRKVVDIELTAEAKVPSAPAGVAEERRASVNILNTADGCTFKKGDVITFEGYADDVDTAITAVEFSMDGGETWTTYKTPGASAEKWVYWYFTVPAQSAGNYRLTVRAVTASGVVSPLSSTLSFTVE